MRNTGIYLGMEIRQAEKMSRPKADQIAFCQASV